MTVADIRPSEDHGRLVKLLNTAPGTQQGEELWRHRKADGSDIEVAVYSRSLRYEGRAAVLVAIRDVTEQRQAEMQRTRAEERITHLAHHDGLTDLPNRTLFCEELDRALLRTKRGDRFALLYLDLDHFKHVNDTHGHLLGDELLKAVATRLRGCVRETDLVARLGGDEFAIIQALRDQSEDPAALAARINDALNASFDLGGREVAVGVSVGISLAPDDSAEREQMLKNADLALYGAKSGGRGTYCFYEPEMDARTKARRKAEADLRDALANGESELHYQPIVNLKTNQVNGCEALLRWHHPERGMVSPAEFIPIAEESGLISALGEWVIRQACTDATSWPDNIKVAVNLSPIQLNTALVQTVVNALAASGMPSHRLELEITETVLMQNGFTTLSTLHQLREFGVRIAMDDFGTGYSSLSYLRSFPFDTIKIDRSFIEDISDKEDCVAIVQAITNMAKQLNISTTAEGVETEEQLAKVRELGCTDMQGFVFSRPRPLAEISRLFLPRAGKAASAA
jgi:diguanylate cyclase (GGDEF)-like protein